MIIKGLSPKVSEKNLEQTVKKVLEEDLGLSQTDIKDFDKTHRVGPVYKDRKGQQQQNTIVRFTSHSSRYKTYLKRKSCKNKSLRFTPSLTDRRRKLLHSCYSKCADNSSVIDFPFTDIHGDIKVKLNVPFDGDYFHKIEKLEDLDFIVNEINGNHQSRIEVNA